MLGGDDGFAIGYRGEGGERRASEEVEERGKKERGIGFFRKLKSMSCELYGGDFWRARERGSKYKPRAWGMSGRRRRRRQRSISQSMAEFGEMNDDSIALQCSALQ